MCWDCWVGMGVSCLGVERRIGDDWVKLGSLGDEGKANANSVMVWKTLRTGATCKKQARHSKSSHRRCMQRS